jgi:hypothetical protein
MGYTRQKKIFNIIWDDEGTDLDGLEIRARAVSTGKYLRIYRLAKAVENAAGDDVEQLMNDMEELFDTFATVLLSWNLQEHEDPDDEDSPLVDVPATKDGFYSQDLELVLAIIFKWIGISSGVGADLGKESTSGDPSLEASLPMEPLSNDPQSLPRPA